MLKTYLRNPTNEKWQELIKIMGEPQRERLDRLIAYFRAHWPKGPWTLRIYTPVAGKHEQCCRRVFKPGDDLKIENWLSELDLGWGQLWVPVPPFGDEEETF